MATLFNTQISATYPGLIKTTDNSAITATLKQLTDGSGNNTGLFVNNAGDFKVTAILEWGSLKDTGTGVTITQWVTSANGIANFNNDTTVPTSKAVKTYVDAVVTASDLDFLGDSNTGTPAVDLDSQNFSVLGTTNQIVTSGANQTLTIGLPNSVTISGTYTGATFAGDLNGTINTATTAATQSAGDNSTKVATTAYVDSLDAASDLDFSGDSGTGDVTLNTQVLAITGTTNQIVTAASNQGLSLSLPTTVHRNLQGNVTGNVTGDLTGNVTATSVLANGVTATTQSSSDDSTKVATTSFVKSLNNASDLDFTTDSGSGAVVLNSQTFSVLGTTNQINSAGSGQAVTLSLPSTIHRNLQGNVTGDLTGNADTATAWETARNLSVTGEATGTLSNVNGTQAVSGAVTLDNNSVTGKVLTGLPTPAASTVLPADSILEGIGKLQSQINGIANGLQFQGSWDADQNSPNLPSGGGEADSGTTTATLANKLVDTTAGQNFLSTVTVGDKVINQVDRQTALVTNVDSNTVLSIDADIMLSGEAYTIDNSPFITQGHYYVVNVGGNTSLNGINTWSVGDWVIAGATNVWEKLDHTDVEGVGTPGNIAKWSATGTIADSIIAESGAAITVTGSLSTTTNLNSGSNFAVNTNKFTANATTGNTAFTGDLAINTNKFTVNATSGNTLVAGTLDVTSTANFASIIGVNGSTTANVPITATTSSGYEDVAYFKSTGTNIDSRISLFPTGTGDGVVNSTANNLILQTGGADRLTINSTTATFAGNLSANIGSFNSPDASESVLMNLVANNGNNAATFRTTASGHIFEIRSQNSGTIKIDSSSTTFAGDVNTGRLFVEQSGADIIDMTRTGVGTYRFAISGSDAFSLFDVGANADRLVIDSSGKVSVGICTGNLKEFNVKNQGSNGGLRIEHSGSANTVAFLGQGGSGDEGVLFLQDSGVDTVKIAGENGLDSFINSGNVGIGTDSPQSKLHIQTDAAPTDIYLTDGTLGTDNYGGVVRGFSVAGQGGRLQLGTLDNDIYYPALTILQQGGNVGIGTDSPDFTLDITNTTFGNQLRLHRSSIASGGFLTLSANDSAANKHDYAKIGAIVESSTNGSEDGALVFQTSLNATLAERMRIDSSGNVNIKNVDSNGASQITPTLSLSFDGGSDINYNIGYLNFLSNDTSTNSSGGVGGIGVYAEEAFNTSFTPSYMSFYTHARTNNDGTSLGNVTERMRLTSGGNLLFGITDEASQPTNKNFFIADFQSGASVTVGGHGGTHTAVTFRHNGATTPGTIVITTNTTTYNTSSDYRLKEDLQDFNGLDKVSKIPVYDFKWKSDESRSYGVMAHELEEVLPQAVNGEKDAEEMQSVDYSKIVPLLVKSIQELKAEVDLLKKECKCK